MCRPMRRSAGQRLAAPELARSGSRDELGQCGVNPTGSNNQFLTGLALACSYGPETQEERLRERITKMKDGRRTWPTRLSTMRLSVTVQGADKGDTTTLKETPAAENIEEAMSGGGRDGGSGLQRCV